MENTMSSALTLFPLLAETSLSESGIFNDLNVRY